ncbi:MBL fold metallo-hydrolase [Blautia hydrogenotrophica]|uniref:MBL fold metallo-hydrolase n=1 Tax=Blautia hydrogenotrophica TaxID=53443 RepID=UPI003AB72FA7
MSMKSEYGFYMQQQNALKASGNGRFFTDQESRYTEPFQIYGNLYYVGDSWVCVHLVDTGDGLLMFDAGNCGAQAMLVYSIWKAGFDPADVKWIILSHGHMDHFGAANFFKRMFGTKIYLSEPDAKMFREHPEQSMVQISGNCMDELFEPDVEIHDGERLKFGSTEIQFYLVPGHTEGCIACFFDVTDGKERKRVGYYGGFGFNTLQKDFLMEIGDMTFEMRRKYLNSLKKVRDEEVELFMGNHTANVDLLAKRKYMQEHPDKNPFLDSQAWKEYLDEKYEELLQLMNDPRQN